MQGIVTFRGEVTLAQKPETPPEDQKVTPERDYLARLALDQKRILQTLPIAKIKLSSNEKSAAELYQQAFVLLGPVAAAPMVCSKQCPNAVCPLAMIGKEPIGDRCPFEQQYVQERFLAWMDNLGLTFDDISETERSNIATLVTLDLHEKRCNDILAEPQNATLTTRAGRAAAVRLNEIIAQRRGILRDMELTPEMQTKKKKALGRLKPGNGLDLASRMSANADKLRRAMQPPAEPRTRAFGLAKSN
jgi:hypothetical protein